MVIKTYEPVNPILKKYVQFYYELELKNEAYYAFPSANNVVCLFNDAKITYSKNQIYIQENTNKENKNTFIALNKFTKPLFVKSEGVVKEFVIIFKPHGFSQFITKDYSKLAFFEIFEFDSFKGKNEFFFKDSIEDKIEKVESYLFENLQEKKGNRNYIKKP